MTYPITLHFCEKLGVIIVFLRYEDDLGWNLAEMDDMSKDSIRFERDELFATNDNVFTSFDLAMDYIMSEEEYENA